MADQQEQPYYLRWRWWLRVAILLVLAIGRHMNEAAQQRAIEESPAATAFAESAETRRLLATVDALMTPEALANRTPTAAPPATSVGQTVLTGQYSLYLLSFERDGEQCIGLSYDAAAAAIYHCGEFDQLEGVWFVDALSSSRRVVYGLAQNPAAVTARVEMADQTTVDVPMQNSAYLLVLTRLQAPVRVTGVTDSGVILTDQWLLHYE